MKMTSGILFSLGVILLLLALSSDAAPKDQHFPFRSRSLPVSPIHPRNVNVQTACTKTTSGDYCSFPFTYLSVKYYSCTKIFHDRPWCSLDPIYKGRWGNCVVHECQQKTAEGKCCSLPFTYKFVTYNSCTKFAHDEPWCALDRYYLAGRWGNCACIENSRRIRKEFIFMTKEERRRYINAVKEVSTKEPHKTNYEKLLASHRTLFFGDIHKKKHFLTWHRWFTLQYENLLRQVDCSVTVPYWDWTSNNAFDTSDKGVWNDNDYGFGGNGTGASQCVQMGPFKESEWSILPPQKDDSGVDNKHCLARNFDSRSLPTEADLQNLLNFAADKFTDFEVLFRDGLHFNAHKGVGGTMFTFNSAAAPEFFLVHAFVDKTWNDWQKKSCAHMYAFFPTVKEPMPDTTTMPSDVIDLNSLPGNIQVIYQSSAVKRRRGQGLMKRSRIPHELDPEIIKLFKVSPDEVKRLKELGELAQRENDIHRYETVKKSAQPKRNAYKYE